MKVVVSKSSIGFCSIRSSQRFQLPLFRDHLPAVVDLRLLMTVEIGRNSLKELISVLRSRHISEVLRATRRDIARNSRISGFL